MMEGIYEMDETGEVLSEWDKLKVEVGVKDQDLHLDILNGCIPNHCQTTYVEAAAPRLSTWTSCVSQSYNILLCFISFFTWNQLPVETFA